jgi:hypothetical protein
MPTEQQDDHVKPDGLAVARFLGFVEGRLRTPIPEAWEEAVKSVHGYSRSAVSFYVPNDKTSSRGLKPEREGDDWIIEIESRRIQLPRDDQLRPVVDAAVTVVDDIGYVALYCSFPVPYRVFAIDLANKQGKWSSKVWGTGDLILYQGRGCHLAECCVTEETLTIFGVSDSCAYIEVFDKLSGQIQWRFCTSYLDLNILEE